MIETTNKKYMLETSYENLEGKEELIKNILVKFEMLLNKEDYYNFQERVYKLNKMLNAINKQTTTVSHFEDFEGLSSSLLKQSSNITQKTLSLDHLSALLDELLRNKESLDKKYFCLATSSSEDGEDELPTKLPVRVEKRKSFLRNLYNYELFLKTYIYEKSLIKEKQTNDDVTSMGQAFTTLNTVESSNLSINNLTITSTKPMEVDSPLTNTPSSSKTENGCNSNKTLNLTPLIKKSFFEDLEVHKIKENRRRSLIEESKSGLAAINVAKRMSGIFNTQMLHSYSHKETKPVESPEKRQGTDQKCEISQFLSLNGNLQLNSVQPVPKRSSIFTSREDFLSNIGETEEYYINISVEGSIKSAGDCENQNN